ncbi:Phytoene/squalene synthetase [Tropicibacter naphthalenivorans]|uniref:Squalene synthase HpnD n=1 Tax=Tropicibacter naphthalenivorans TaxID=441103 RepID=A0A0P1G4J2_9RHOB|nr:squalene synthase HpnD [Tropicibacter naphthalenivorans]SMC63348.1 Phytoene/squalene synthetase [Tropicibacter naphthalenivorans]
MHACAQIVEKGDAERFASVMAADVAARRVLFPIYAFNVEVARVPWMTAEPMIAQMRLQWWADALEEIAGGGFIRRHEVVTPLALAISAPVAERLQQVVEARRLDIERAPFDDVGAFWTYLGDTSGALTVAAAAALGDTDGRAARSYGLAVGLAGYLRAVPELEARGKQPLADGRPEAVKALADEGLAHLAEARRALKHVPKAARAAFAPAVTAGPVLRRVAQDPARVASGDLTPPEAAVRWGRLRGAFTGRW